MNQTKSTESGTMKKENLYERRVRELESEGLTTSDAQSVADCEVLDGKLAEELAAEVAHPPYVEYLFKNISRRA
ncbi:hypothetical protein UFOVP1313_52 [uncultured Caudovirales phage]|uniref:Uncharacterized protein n=1 Tax=uncultured Caudovirales phage TaxID=2100421 RepID=A0A6J5RVJ1_9CAUD|nr:hypothetical protein UFOVP1313_52 [uncultured Caudovirales phage]